MTRLFGTDGVRGVANRELTPDLAFKLGWAGSRVLTGTCCHQPTILVGQDGRLSCDMLESALVAGICSAGAHAMVAGVVPTPGIAYLCRTYQCDAGVMISASHNSYEFNGIKFFNQDGYKLPDEIEDQIETLIHDYDNQSADPLIGDKIGRRISQKQAADDYCQFLKEEMGLDLSGVKLALDCANGASSAIAPRLFRSLGAEVVAIGNLPDGININDGCGSLHLDQLASIVCQNQCDLGLAFDGDADRMLAVDESGVIVDGDVIMAIIASDMKDRHELKHDTLVATVMSNLGLDKMAQKKGINLVKTQVGDRYVLEEMLRSGYSVGGEQSGHIILLDHATTGDGILSALRLLHALNNQQMRLKEASQIMTVLPQVLKKAHVSNGDKPRVMQDEMIQNEIEQIRETLADRGRVLVRPSGTEPIIRVMIEGEDIGAIEQMADHLSSVITKRFNS